MHTTYIEVTIHDVSAEQSEILIAQLAETGFDGFEEMEHSLKAFTNQEQFSKTALEEILAPFDVKYVTEIITSKNWNEEWEKNFDPVIVDDFVAIRADFHAPINNVNHEILITPKMSFGTGHHATTFLMMQQMRAIDFSNKSVFDFGTGTGILAILAEKLGAVSIFAIDNDEWSIKNAEENAEKNGSLHIDLSLSDDPAGKETFDIVLANINKNIILAYLSVLVNRLKKGGYLLLSGLLKDDEEDIQQAAKALSVKYMSTTHKNNWICITFLN